MNAINIPIPITTIGKAILLGMVVMLSLGSAQASGPSHKLVAQSTLKPVQINQAPQKPAVVQERIVKASIPSTPKQPVAAVSGGGKGYVMPGNNCVVCVRALTGRSQNGNAGTWKASSSTPTIGAIMIWRPGQGGASSAGHVGVVRGINPDGTVEIAHCNWSGQTRFASTGLFW